MSYRQNITYQLLSLTYALRMLGHSDAASTFTLFYHHAPVWERGN